MKGFQLVVEVESVDKIHILKCEDWESRGKNCLELLKRLLRRCPKVFEGKIGGISFGDQPPSSQWANQFDFSFSSTKQLNKPCPCLPIPCPYSLRWPAVGISNAEEMMGAILEDKSPSEIDRIFWIGADTHVSRRKLWEIGQLYPDQFDVAIMEWDRNAPGGQRSKTRQVSIPEHRKYKYLIDCPGYGYSARLKWLLATGSPVFVVERNDVEHWHDEMEPWVHFVPVAADLSDLLESHAYLEEDRNLYDMIGRNARAFADARLRVDKQLDYSAKVILSVHRELSIQPINPHNAEQKKAVMVVARFSEKLNWLDLLPDWIDVVVINKGSPLSGASFGRRNVIVMPRPNLGREADSYLSFMEGGGHIGYEWIIFTQGDPFSHSPEFLNLLDQFRIWQDIQPLSCQWFTGKCIPPLEFVANDRENWVLDFPVRKELFSLHTLRIIRFHDPGVATIFNRYRDLHGLKSGDNLSAHFLEMVALSDLAEKAHTADLGNFSFGAIFSVRSQLVEGIPLECIRAMRRLCQRDDVHAYILERLWLHLFGEPFQHPKPAAAIWHTETRVSKNMEVSRYWNHHTIIIQDLGLRLKAESYLEIGIADGLNFAAIGCDRKVAVDSNGPEDVPGASVYRMTSDEFFAANEQSFDMVFIDGLHHADQVYRDLNNALRFLNRGGVVVCHDLSPSTEKMQMVPRVQREWTGDGWKSWVRLRRERPDLHMIVVNCDYGVGIILDGASANPSVLGMKGDLTWSNFEIHRQEWLYLLSPSSARRHVIAHTNYVTDS